ncbi:hypothetical protein ACYF6T_43180, partial [Streptomyces sp. 7R007]
RGEDRLLAAPPAHHLADPGSWSAAADGRSRPDPRKQPPHPARRPRRTFEQTVQFLELFLHREGRAPAARETIRVDGETVRIGAWLAKARTKHRAEKLPTEHVDLVAALFDGDWTAEDAAPAVLG